MNKSLVALGMATALAAIPAQSAFVDHGTYVTDTISGLDWYDVSLTVNTGYTQLQTLLTTTYAGWHLATPTEVIDLLAHGGIRYTEDPRANLNTRTQIRQFLDDFGGTLRNCIGCGWSDYLLGYYDQQFPYSIQGNPYYQNIPAIEVMFLAIPTDATAANFAGGPIVDIPGYPYTGPYGAPMHGKAPYYSSAGFEFIATSASSTLAPLLVRNVVVSTVPEGPTSALFAMGLLAVALGRRKLGAKPSSQARL